MGLLLDVTEGVYLEPRAGGTKATDSDFAVVWLTEASRDVALPFLKLATHGFSLIRMKARFGIRVLSKHGEAAYKEVRPGNSFIKINVQKTHPLPHRLQRQQVIQLLKEWQWTAKPLEPLRGTAEGGT